MKIQVDENRGQHGGVADKINYNLVRSEVKAAYSTNAAPYEQSPLSDHITTKPRSELARSRTHYPTQRGNAIVQARETRRQGRSREPLGYADWDACLMRRRIARLNRAYQLACDYFYNGNSIAGKHPAKLLIWDEYLPTITHCNIETRDTGLLMLDRLLPCYRIKMLQGVEDYPAQPWKLFEDMDRKAWYATYRPHWIALKAAIERLDIEILDMVR